VIPKENPEIFPVIDPVSDNDTDFVPGGDNDIKSNALVPESKTLQRAADEQAMSDEQHHNRCNLRRCSQRPRRPNRNPYEGKGGAGVARAKVHDTRKVKHSKIESLLDGSDWDTAVGNLKSNDYSFSVQVKVEFKFHQLVALSMKANSANNPNWNQAMKGPESEGYWKSMELELETRNTHK
jgi:hypothetical protein